ncbi:MAG: sigma-70 family RNA polymerase sigma factor [Saprospiraceae bacterium]
MHDAQSIWTEFHRELKGFIAKAIRNPHDADDILQDTFLKISRNPDKISGAENLRHYLYGIVRNVINDYFRHKKTDHNDPQWDSSTLSEDDKNTLNSTIAECCVRPFIGQLPEKYREALLISEFENFSQKELAEKLNISYSGAKSRVQRGKEKLKELLLNCCAYESDRYGNLFSESKKDCNC